MKKLLSIIVMVICLGVSGQLNAQCTDRPIINDFSPKTGFIGSTVTITGANFNATPTNNQVFFGATQATVVSSSFGTLEVRVPEGSTTALISVKNDCNLTAYSKTHFNGIFCPTPLTASSYQNTSQELSGIYGAYNMLSQDMDNDGKPEVISARNGGGITVAINNSTPGTISFAAYNNGSTNGAAQSIATADFDGDGLKDIVTNSAIMRNTSTGVGNIGLIYVTDSRAVSNYQVGAGDFNNDGKIDIIGENGNTVWIAFNTSTGPGNFNFTARQVVQGVGSRCTGIQVADLDGDGKTDFVASQGGANRAVSIRNTTADGSFTASFETPEYWSSDPTGAGTFPYRAMIADFDKDGRIDFTSCNYTGTTNTAIWRNTSSVGNISFATTVNIPSPINNYRIGVGDVDGDGYPDIVTKSLGVNVFSVYRNTTSAAGTPSFAARFDYTSSNRAEVSGIVIGDLDGDFVPDIATSGISSNTIRFHRNTGAQNDVTPPTVSCRNITVALSPTGTVTITPEMIDNGSGDACGIESLVLSQVDFTCADIGENTVTLTATDGAGNESTCTATVNVQPAAIIVAGQSTVCQGETVNMNANDGDSYQWKKDGTDIAGAITQNYIATETGNYTVVVTNAGGCSGESLITPVVVNENPTVDISPAGNAFLCPPNNSTTLTATQSSIYQWMKDGVDIPNATQQSYNVTTVGNYNVRVIDLFGCSAVSDVTSITANPAEIEVQGNGDFGNAFPNQNYTQTIVISNLGTGNLDITNLQITGIDSGSFSIIGFNSPGTLAPGTTANVDVVFNAPNITTYSAFLSLNSNDCDEGFISIPLTAEITCVAASFTSVPESFSVNNDIDVCGAIVNYNVTTVGNPTETLTYELSGATTGSGSGSATGLTFNIGVTTVTLNTQNPCGNVTESFDITVIDNQPPNIIYNEITVQLNENGIASFTAEMIDNGSTDNCGIESITISENFYECGDVGAENFVVFEVTDVNGNTDAKNVRVTVVDNILPTAIAQDVTVQLDVNGNASITPEMVDNGSSDNCEIESLTLSKTNFDCSDILNGCGAGSALDINGINRGVNIPNMIPTNTFTLEAWIFNRSNAPGWRTLIEFSNDAPYFGIENGGYLTLYQSGARANTPLATNQWHHVAVSYQNGVSNLYLNGTLVSTGSNTVNTSGTDVGIGFNAGDNPFTGIIDEVKIWDTVRTLENINTSMTNCSQSPETGLVGYWDMNEASGNTISDKSGNNKNGTIIDATTWSTSDRLVNGGNSNEVILTVTDASGNVSTTTANVTVQDNISPEFLTTETAFILLDENGVATYDTDGFNRDTVVDNCGIDRLEFGKTVYNCDEIGFHTINVTAFDVNGNSTAGTIEIEVREEIAPTVITQNIEVILDANGAASITTADVDNGSFDNCSFTLSLDTIDFSCENVGDNIVNLTAIDNHGLQTTAQATVTVIDNTLPTAVTQDITVQLDDTGNVAITSDMIDNGSADNCTFTTSLDIIDFTCANVGDNTVTFTVTDASGNVATTTANVTVIDSVPTEVITQNIDVFLDADGNAAITTTDIDNGSSDACGIATLELDITSFSCANLGDNTVTLTATDVNGNVSNNTAMVTVIDNIAPIVGTQNISVELDANGNATITPLDVIISSESDVETGEECDVTDAKYHAIYLSSYVKNYNNHSKGNGKIKVNSKKKEVDFSAKNDASRHWGARFKFDANGGKITKNLDGTASVTGTLVNKYDSNDQWVVTINLKNASTWEEWKALGRSWKGNPWSVRKEYKNWMYYEMAQGSVLTGAGNNAGTVTEIFHAPTSLKYGFQLGNKANLQDADFGLSGWFYYKNRRGRWAQGDFNFDVSNCSDLPIPEGTIITSDNCSIESYSLSTDSFGCDNLGENTIQVSVTDQSGNTTTKDVIITVLGETPVVSIPDFYSVYGQKKNTVFLGYKESVHLCPTVTGGDGFIYEWTDDTGTVISTEALPEVSPTITTNYKVTVTNSNGCSASASIEVCVIDARSTKSYSHNHGHNHHRGGSCNHSSHHNEKVIICHHTKKRGVIKHHEISVSKYAVRAHLRHGDTLGSCNAICLTAEDIVEEDPIVSVIGIYPNPSTGMFNVKLENFAHGSLRVTLHDFYGRTIQYKNVRVNSDEENVTMGSRRLRNGTYILKVMSNGELFTKTVIVDRRH
jgi:hypothetical protein